MTQLTDRSGRVLAYLHDVSPYRKEIRDRSNVLLGWYEPHTGKTFDRTGRVVSNSGDARGSLIPASE